MRKRRGFTLAETLTAMVIFGIVGSVLLRVLLAHGRLYESEVQRVMVVETARAGIAVLMAEVRQLSAADGDIIAMDPSSITYESMQAFYVQCAPPDTSALAVLLDRDSFSGLRPLAAIDDSVLIFAEADTATRMDDDWLVAGVRTVTTGSACPGGRPSLTATLDGVTPAQLARVQAGAPARTFRPSRVLIYPDAAGSWWLGSREYHTSANAWSTTQPVVGPLSANGLRFTFSDAGGTPTPDPKRVVRIGIEIQGQSAKPVPRWGGTGPGYQLQHLATHVALRNNPWY